ncbi:MAG: hypothetical protein E4H11_09830 [Myxococcales bacterium]|nr:MAG: hypothetical protein E4H11_09830 [Myxococcales bacterium]
MSHCAAPGVCCVGCWRAAATRWSPAPHPRPARSPSAVGQRLVEFGCIRHVRGEHGFRDGHSFFRFREDEAEAA